jgi:hypothetical protein
MMELGMVKKTGTGSRRSVTRNTARVSRTDPTKLMPYVKYFSEIVSSIKGIHPRSINMLLSMMRRAPQNTLVRGDISVLSKQVFSPERLYLIYQAIKGSPTYKALEKGTKYINCLNNDEKEEKKVILMEHDSKNISSEGVYIFQYEYREIHSLIKGDLVGLVMTRAQHDPSDNDYGYGNGSLFTTKGIISFTYHFDTDTGFSGKEDRDSYYISLWVPADKGSNPKNLPELVKEVLPDMIFKKAISMGFPIKKA